MVSGRHHPGRSEFAANRRRAAAVRRAMVAWAIRSRSGDRPAPVVPAWQGWVDNQKPDPVTDHQEAIMDERSSYPDGEPCWADVVTNDLEAAQRFYHALFGWEYQNSGPEMGNYSTALVTGKPVAGIMPPPPGSTGIPPAWSVYLASSDLDATAAKIDQVGAKVIMGPMDIPGTGRMMIGMDPTGAPFGVWQAGGHIGAEVVGVPGAPAWAELHTRDGATADSFYRSLFGYQQQQVGDGVNFDYTVWSLGDRQVAGRMVDGSDMPADGAPRWTIYFSVDDADAAVARAAAAGGRVVTGPDDSPYGRMAVVADPDGAVFSVIDMSRRTEV
jgi:predicted enzyme related to lactoylglutathione lyase